MKFIIILAVALQYALALKACTRPDPYYNSFINHKFSERCSCKKITDDGIRAQSAGVAHLLCSAPESAKWKKGTKLTTSNGCNETILLFSPIAVFTGASGEYIGKKSHAGIFISCHNGNVVIADQWCAKPGKFSERTLKRGGSLLSSKNDADNYYSIEW